MRVGVCLRGGGGQGGGARTGTQLHTAGVPQQCGLSKAVSRCKAVKIAWRGGGIALITRNEYGGFPL